MNITLVIDPENLEDLCGCLKELNGIAKALKSEKRKEFRLIYNKVLAILETFGCDK